MACGTKHEEHRLLPTDDYDTESASWNETGSIQHQPVALLLRRLSLLWRFLVTLFSIILVIAMGFGLGYQHRVGQELGCPSPYLKLEFDHPDEHWWGTKYSDLSASDAELNRLWDLELPWESGIIALTNAEARAMNLPTSQPFPWDAKAKSLYIVNAHHLLHCVRNIYISIQEYRTNKTQSIQYPHILHCLDTLRVEAMCSADDTLLYVPSKKIPGAHAGEGQERKCRDWKRVQEFVEAHDPCYRHRPELPDIEQFQFCPPNSEYLPRIRQYFGYDDEWVPQATESPLELDW